MTKHCKKCTEEYPLDKFSKAKNNADGYSSVCKPCRVSINKEYWRTQIGRLSQIYSVQRMTSKQREHDPPTYTLKELSFWANSNGFFRLWSAWRDNAFIKALTPSIDRLDPTKGYSLNNIRLVTWTENNDKAYTDRKSCVHITKQNRGVNQLTVCGKHIATYGSISAAARHTGITRVNINDVCRGKKSCHTAGGFCWEYST